MTAILQSRQLRLTAINKRIASHEKTRDAALRRAAQAAEDAQAATAERDALIAVSVEYPEPVKLEDK